MERFRYINTREIDIRSCVKNIRMSNYKLIYFDGRGFGEPARQLFHLAGVPFEDIRVSFEELMPGKQSESWLEMKESEF